MDVRDRGRLAARQRILTAIASLPEQSHALVDLLLTTDDDHIVPAVSKLLHCSEVAAEHVVELQLRSLRPAYQETVRRELDQLAAVLDA